MTRLEELLAEKEEVQTVIDSCKTSANGSYGKFGSKYSFLFAPEMLINTTITGQLALLMLVERVGELGVKVTSANTDSIDLYYPESIIPELEAVIFNWEQDTGYDMGITEYRSKHSRSVNNYLAVKANGSIKRKGEFARGGLRKNIGTEIVTTAIINYISKGEDIETTIYGCKDVREFIGIRNVRGGGVYGGDYLGKVVRFYHSTVDGYLSYKANGNKVATTNACKPLMVLPENNALPSDLDIDWYVDEAYKLLKLMGVEV